MSASEWPIITLSLRSEADVVLARQRARQVSSIFDLNELRQTRVATAVSEIARNALVHGGGGRVEMFLAGGAARARLVIRISDAGGGIPARPQRPGDSGVPRGLMVAERLSDAFHSETSTEGTRVTLTTILPTSVRGVAGEAREAADALTRRPPETLLEEVQRQNQEIVRVLEDLMSRQEDLLRLNEELEETNRGVVAFHQELTRELEETNRGVVALYGELDDRTEELRRTNNLKDQFISYLSHEFRTPVHSVIALSNILLGARDAELTAEQQTQVQLILRSASGLLELVDDMLDLAKISAGRLGVRPEVVTVTDLFSTLRGMMRPLVPSDHPVSLIFSDAVHIPLLYTDQGKLSQIMRNLVSNALKFTNEGEVRISAKVDGDFVVFAVADTGIGIAEKDRSRIFGEYEQVEGAFQRRARGTGLGLPLSQRLAELLGGRITIESEAGAGSTFRLRIPLRYNGVDDPDVVGEGPIGRSTGEAHILIVDDDQAARYVLRHLLESLGCTVTEATSGEDLLRLARAQTPGAIIADLVMPGMDGFELLQRLRADPLTSTIPVIIRTGKRLTDEDRDRLAGRAADVLTKDEDGTDRNRAALRVGAALVRIGISTHDVEAPS